MSAIFGILRFDNAAVSARDLERMSNVLAHRGPDGRKFVARGRAGLGHCLLRINQEDAFEAQPLYDSEANATLVADCRIDNREELAGVFGIGAAELRDLPDSALVMRAYKQWGEDCAEHLLGDFAFALWDGRQQKLVLARDHMGQRNVYYHRGERFLAFATEIKGLWALPDVPSVLSEKYLGRMMALLIAVPSPGITPFDDIAGLPGGTVMTVTSAGLSNARRYWTPQPDPAHMNRDEAYYVDAYRRVLGEAVACRLRRTTAPAGLLFSGGFDSGAIAALAGPVVRAQHRKLIAVTSVAPQDYRGPKRQARPWVELCQRDMPHLDVHFVTHEGVTLLTGLERGFLQLESQGSIIRYADQELHKVIAAAGARVVMDGHGGDYTINPRGQKTLARFLATGQWRRFIAEFGPWRRHRRQMVLQTIKEDIVYVLLLRPLVEPWRRFRNGMRPFGVTLPASRAFIRRMRAQGVVRGRRPGDARGFSMRADIERALRQQQDSAVVAASPLAAAHGLQFTRPFHDKRVVELGLAVPEDLYVRDGRPRAISRKAFAALYPPEFQDRPITNDRPVPDFLPMVESIAPQLLADIDRMERDERLARYVDFPRIRRLIRAASRHELSGNQPPILGAVRTYLLARYVEWFERSNSQPPGRY